MKEGKKNLIKLCIAATITSVAFLLGNKDLVSTNLDQFIFLMGGFGLLIIPVCIGLIFFKKKIIEVGVLNG